MDIKALCGISLVIIIGVARIAGGVIGILSPDSMAEHAMGFGLFAVGIFLILSAVMLWIKKNTFRVTMVTLATLIFWLSGLVNDLVMYGHLQRSGQIINLCCVLCIVTMIRGIEDGDGDDKDNDKGEKLDLTQLRKK